jgi:hypothetical protein
MPDLPAPEKSNRPGRKSKSNKEIEERIEVVANMLALDVRKSSIKKFCLEKFGVGYRSAEVYISRARELLVKWSKQSSEEHYIEALAWWRGVIQNQSTDWPAKMRARENLDRLFGIKPPEEHVLRGDPNSPIGVHVTIETILAARRRIADWRKERFGELGHDGNGAGNGETGAAGPQASPG